MVDSARFKITLRAMTDAFGERRGLEGAERGIENSRDAKASENHEWGILMIVRRLKRGTLRLRVYLNFSKIGVRLIEIEQSVVNHCLY